MSSPNTQCETGPNRDRPGFQTFSCEHASGGATPSRVVTRDLSTPDQLTHSFTRRVSLSSRLLESRLELGGAASVVSCAGEVLWRAAAGKGVGSLQLIQGAGACHTVTPIIVASLWCRKGEKFPA